MVATRCRCLDGDGLEPAGGEDRDLPAERVLADYLVAGRIAVDRLANLKRHSSFPCGNTLTYVRLIESRLDRAVKHVHRFPAHRDHLTQDSLHGAVDLALF